MLKWLPETSIQVIELESIFLSHFTTKHKELDGPYPGLLNQQDEFLDSSIYMKCQVAQTAFFSLFSSLFLSAGFF